MELAAVEETEERKRCVIVVDAALPPGRAANAASVIALTLGSRHPGLAGADLVDAAGRRHPGLIPIGITILAAPVEALRDLRDQAVRQGLDVVDFPTAGQETTDYAAFRDRVAQLNPEAIDYVGVGILGGRKAVGRVTGKLPLLR